MLIKKIPRIVCLLALVGVWTTSSVSAEFQDSETLPNILKVGFGRDIVGFASNEAKDSISHTLFGPRIYLFYERNHREMVEVDGEQFRERFPVKSLLDGPNTSNDLMTGHTANGVGYSLSYRYCGEGDTDDTRQIVVDGKTIHARTQEECTNVSSVEIVDGHLWLGTAYSGEGGFSQAEGIVVQDMNGTNVFARINSLSGWVAQLHLDPFSRNIWAITENGIYEISPQFTILSANFFYHDFDPSTGQPRLLSSSKATPSNPFAVISRLLPNEDRKNFYAAVTKIPKKDQVKFTLYDFFMCCDFNAKKYPESFQPLTPFFIRASLRNDALLQNSWRQSICRLGSPESKQYCR